MKDQSQKEVKLSDFKGKKNVVLVFYPLDWSPTCTNEHACFVNDMKKFEQLDAQVMGISVDSAWSHKAYAEKMGIQYPLLADFQPRGAVAINSRRACDKGITGRASQSLIARAISVQKLRYSRGSDSNEVADAPQSEVRRGRQSKSRYGDRGANVHRSPPIATAFLGQRFKVGH